MCPSPQQRTTTMRLITDQYCTQIETTCKVWAGRGPQRASVRIDNDGAVYVYDDVASHWTRCHSIAERTIARWSKMISSGMQK